MKLELKLTIS